MKTLSAAALSALLIAGAAAAQNPPNPPLKTPPAPSLPMALAQEAAQAALDSCAKNLYRASVTVVDSAGGVKVKLMTDGVNQPIADSSDKKAAAAAILKAPTKESQAKAKTDADFAATAKADKRLMLSPGGLPISYKDQVVGGIGVGGAPNDDIDEACAAAGLAKIKDRL